MQRSWPEVPEWVFCSEMGTPLDERNVLRSWERVRRRALKLAYVLCDCMQFATPSPPSLCRQGRAFGGCRPTGRRRSRAHAARLRPLPSYGGWRPRICRHRDVVETFENGSERTYPAPALESMKTTSGQEVTRGYA